ncbi:MAG: SAM-dependent methyltransferase [Actinoallomurus sp.]
MAEVDEPDGIRAEAALRDGLGRGRFRSVAEIRRMFGRLELVEPGLVRVPEWRPDPGGLSSEDHPVLRLAVAGLGRV